MSDGHPPHPSVRVVGPGQPFEIMLRGALLPAALGGVLAGIGLVVARGPDAIISVLLGLAVSIGFFGSGMFLMSRLVRSTNPHAFFAVAMAVYLGQVLVLLLFILIFREADWVDGPALGITALVVTIVWQGAAMWAMKRARILVYDEPDEPGAKP